MGTLQIPPYGQHVLFLGTNGSGKSMLAEKMLQKVANFFAVDTQDGLDIVGTRIRSPDDWRLNFLTHYPRIHYVPDPEHLERPIWDTLFRKLLNSSSKRKKHSRVMYIDEIYHIGYANSFPSWLSKSITTGRQKGLSYWISTQRPRMIPPELITEASLIFVFCLSKFDDKKFISSYAREEPKELMDALQKLRLDDHDFICINNRTGEWNHFSPIKL